jgi:outer membrane receptor for ferric coprogen and ferric-rhodotorulic acid
MEALQQGRYSSVLSLYLGSLLAGRSAAPDPGRALHQYNIRYNPAGSPDTRLESTKDDVTPYAGLVYDINEDWSTYVSYTSIFQPQDKRDASGRYLDPTTGKSYEAGVKADWFNTRLTTSLAIFRIEQDNVASNTYTYMPSGERFMNRTAWSAKGSSSSSTGR